MIMSLKQREIKFKPRINYYYSPGTLRNVQIMAASEITDLHTLVEGCLAWNLAQWARELLKLLAHQENLLVPDDLTGHFSSPDAALMTVLVSWKKLFFPKLRPCNYMG